MKDLLPHMPAGWAEIIRFILTVLVLAALLALMFRLVAPRWADPQTDSERLINTLSGIALWILAIVLAGVDSLRTCRKRREKP